MQRIKAPLHTVNSMNKSRLHRNKEYQNQHDSPGAFPQSPSNCSNNKHLGLLLYCKFGIKVKKLDIRDEEEANQGPQYTQNLTGHMKNKR